MSDMIRRLNSMPWFKFISSIRLAVPLMVIIIISVAVGTILESMYSSDYAKLAVYSADWFFLLMIVLWINIFAAMISRIPWKKHHLGFVTTHIGMLTMLIGGFITGTFGIDGSLQIPEKQTNGTVVLPRLMLGYQLENSPSLQSVTFDRTLTEKSGSSLSFINEKLGHILTAEKFIPFAQVERSFAATNDPNGPIALSFILKSQFFNVSEWLHSEENPQMQMGPATLRLVVDSDQPRRNTQSEVKPTAKSAKSTARKSKQKGASEGAATLQIFQGKEKKLVRSIAVNELRKSPIQIGDVKVELKAAYQRATVAENKIVESPDPSGPPNPALELQLQKSGETQREILYAKFPDFSLNKKGNFGLSFVYTAGVGMESSNAPSPSAEEAADTGGMPPGHPAVGGSADGGGAPMGGGNTIEFHVDRKQPDRVRVELHKGGKKLQEAWVKEGGNVQTPWMGIVVYVGSLVVGGQPTTRVQPIKPEPGAPLPPSAIQIRPAGASETFWLAQGEVKTMQIGGRPMTLVYSNQTLSLPFELRLEKFSKVDYPGTDTPMSFESLVELKGVGSMHRISMNEPLKNQGYTLYQASYSMNPGQPPTTVLSVNWDPGRPVKYLGSLILAIGIVTFTFMRSRLNQARKRAES